MHVASNEQVKLKDVVSLLNEIVPASLAEKWDNVGLMLGRPERKIKRVMVCLDVSPAVIEQAIAAKVDLVISHHPLIFKPISNLDASEWRQDFILTLAENNIAVFSAHTNLDAVADGVNDVLAKAIGLEDYDILDDDSHIGRIGEVSSISIEQFASNVKKVLGCDYLVFGNAGKPVHRVAVCGGAGADFIDKAISLGADTFITGDVKYHDFQRAVYAGLNIIDAGHQTTERLVVEELADKLSIHFTELNWNINIFVAKEKLLMKHI